jgi:hypothetical protein
MSSCNYWVFREGRNSVRGEVVRAGLVEALRSLRLPSEDHVLEALLRAGELETALADVGAPDAAAAAVVTNALAAALVGFWTADIGLASLAFAAERLRIPETLDLSTPEGFAYYALHPLAYAEVADKIALAARPAAIVGIRSIGTTLGAVVAASFARRNIAAQRISVRPCGHPYDRKTEFTPEQVRWIAANRSREAAFLVVDEGPGLSGSSLLSVGDALLMAGVERRHIHFLCSHDPDPGSLSAPGASQRWRSFQTLCVGNAIPRLPPGARHDCGGGEWRRWLYPGEAHWPASWTQMERVKFLSPARDRIFKFSGYGRFGASVKERDRLLSSSGFGPPLLGVSNGFAEFAVLPGRPATPADLSTAIIERIADYCAFRAIEFRVAHTPSRLHEMTVFNVERLSGSPSPEWLVLEHSGAHVLCDARMQPHEWIVAAGGSVTKADGASHGDDHFLPGPCDIAWDLAGAVVEWEMNAHAAEALLRRYQTRSGDDARPRLRAYAVAYAGFRAAYCAMAAFALRGSKEAERLDRAVQRYRAGLTRAIQSASQKESAVASPLSSSLPARLCLEPRA